jgi:sugar-phosphatase
MTQQVLGPLDALLFDMDGTLTLSRAASERCWRRWAARRDMDAEEVLRVCHGRQAQETIKLVAPKLDSAAEAAWLLEQELSDPEGVEAVAGAAAFLKQLPAKRWALVTSAAEKLARYRLKLAKLPQPECMVCADDVDAGKPDPAGYSLAARKLGADPARCVVFEDTAVGIEAGSRAGMRTIGIDASDAGAPKGADWVVSSYDALVFEAGPPMQIRRR